jgi:hypothetical protein
MRRRGGRSRAGRALAATVILFAVTGMITMVTVSRNLGNTLIGGAVIGGVALLAFQSPRKPTA